MNAMRFLLFGLVIGGVQLSHARSAAATPAPQTGIIVDIQPREPPGQLKVSRKRNETPVDGMINMQVRRGDLLILEKGANATVVCDGSKKKYPLRPNVSQACPCSAGLGVKQRGPYDIFNPRAGRDTELSSFPVIISPRSTLILNPRPRLRWSDVSKSASGTSTTDTVYSVSIYTDNGTLRWSREGIRKNEMAYPYDAPALMPGEYLLVVKTGTHDSNDEYLPGRGFTVLPTCSGRARKRGDPPCLAQQVREEEGRIRRMNLPDDSTRLLLARLYTHNGLYAEAIEELERVSETVKTPPVISQLGNLYALVGLNREAINLYLEALSLPTMASDLEARASTLRSLAFAFEQLGKRDQARAKYDEAIRAYGKLGDKRMVTILKNQRP